MRIKVYELACGNYYITDKNIKGCSPDASFESVTEAEDFIESVEGWEYCDRDLLGESGYSYDGADYELHSFDFTDELAS